MLAQVRERSAGRGKSGSEAQPRFQHLLRNNPSIYLDIDRDKAQMLGVPLNSSFSRCRPRSAGIL